MGGWGGRVVGRRWVRRVRVNFLYCVRAWGEIRRRMRRRRVLGVPVAAFSLPVAVLAFLALVDSVFFNFLFGWERINLIHIATLVLSVPPLYFFYLRLVYQSRQIDIQIDKEIDDRFNAAVGLLGSGETSARTGAVYSLYHLALQSEKYRREVALILCSHVRSKTREPGYREENGGHPSNEIQTVVNLLFRGVNGLVGLYVENYEDLLPANLSRAYLRGADFMLAECRGADFGWGDLRGAGFWSADCRGADFGEADLRGADFREADCRGVDFRDASCQGVNFWWAECQGVNFVDAGCQGANFEKAICQGADFQWAECQGAYFGGAKFQGAVFDRTKFHGVFSVRSVVNFSIRDRINQPTEIENMQFMGALTEDEIKSIKSAEEYLLQPWGSGARGVAFMQEGESDSYDPADAGIRMGESDDCHIVTGRLEDGDVVRGIIKELEEIRVWRGGASG